LTRFFQLALASRISISLCQALAILFVYPLKLKRVRIESASLCAKRAQSPDFRDDGHRPASRRMRRLISPKPSWPSGARTPHSIEVTSTPPSSRSMRRSSGLNQWNFLAEEHTTAAKARSAILRSRVPRGPKSAANRSALSPLATASSYLFMPEFELRTAKSGRRYTLRTSIPSATAKLSRCAHFPTGKKPYVGLESKIPISEASFNSIARELMHLGIDQ
jgi:hypothetical protein